jgi:hypothetical protein
MNWSGRTAVAAVAMTCGLALTAAGGAGTGAGTGTPNLSTDEAVYAYLLSIGVDPAGVVIQRGSKNYAGPKCPGTDWICTTASRVVQVAPASGQNRVECGDPALLGVVPSAPYPPANVCIAVQQLSGPPFPSPSEQQGDNHFRCHVKDTTNPTVTPQTCEADQSAAPGGHNHAGIHMIIQQTTGLTQTARQRADVNQQNADGFDNHAETYQLIEQSTTAAGGAVVQDQKADQSALVNQVTSQGGDNSSHVNQSQFQKAHAKGTTQMQNAADADATTCRNTCADITQASDSGRNSSSLSQSWHPQAKILDKDATGTQTQGFFGGGLEGEVDQTSDGVSTSTADQVENQDLSGPQAVLKFQVGPQSCCSMQATNERNKVDIDQTSAQRAVATTVDGVVVIEAVDPFATQSTSLTGRFDTTGDGTINHQAKTNGDQINSSCPPTGFDSEDGQCAIQTTCTQAEDSCESVPEPEITIVLNGRRT